MRITPGFERLSSIHSTFLSSREAGCCFLSSPGLGLREQARAVLKNRWGRSKEGALQATIPEKAAVRAAWAWLLSHSQQGRFLYDNRAGFAEMFSKQNLPSASSCPSADRVVVPTPSPHTLRHGMLLRDGKSWAPPAL